MDSVEPLAPEEQEQWHSGAAGQTRLKFPGLSLDEVRRLT